MKRLLLVLILFCAFFAQGFSQAFVKFDEKPDMQLNESKQHFNYKILYNALKKSTIYLELKRGDSLVANGIYDVPKADTKVVPITVSVFPKIGRLQPANNYSYNMYMYEGGRNDWTKKACETIVINNVVVGEPKKSTPPPGASALNN